MKSLLGCLALMAFVATRTNAAPIPVFLEVTDGTSVVSLNPDGIVTPDGHYLSQGMRDTSTFSLAWTIFADPSIAFINGSGSTISLDIEVINLTQRAQTYSAVASLPVAALGSTMVNGQWDGSIADLNGDGVTLSTDAITGAPMLSGLVDGTPVFSSFSHPFLLVGAPGKGNGTIQVGPGPDPVPGPPVHSEIGIELRFTLSAGDKAFSSGEFGGVLVPEPSGLALFGVAAIIAAGFVRRRKQLFNQGIQLRGFGINCANRAHRIQHVNRWPMQYVKG